MKPSNYNYLKRMWTRTLCKKKWGCSQIIIMPIKYAILFFALPFLVSVSDYLQNNTKIKIALKQLIWHRNTI